uniref:Uncharacterized protein n=1 Tax=viral metagenome TaxID=1070528 RepID=A0A6H1ZFX9_9ZZZZ
MKIIDDREEQKYLKMLIKKNESPDVKEKQKNKPVASVKGVKK